jgi:hypothetical protein
MCVQASGQPRICQDRQRPNGGEQCVLFLQRSRTLRRSMCFQVDLPADDFLSELSAWPNFAYRVSCRLPARG